MKTSGSWCTNTSPSWVSLFLPDVRSAQEASSGPPLPDARRHGPHHADRCSPASSASASARNSLQMREAMLLWDSQTGSHEQLIAHRHEPQFLELCLRADSLFPDVSDALEEERGLQPEVHEILRRQLQPLVTGNGWQLAGSVTTTSSRTSCGRKATGRKKLTEGKYSTTHGASLLAHG